MTLWSYLENTYQEVAKQRKNYQFLTPVYFLFKFQQVTICFKKRINSICVVYIFKVVTHLQRCNVIINSVFSSM